MSTMAIIMALFLVLRQVAKIFNDNKLIDKSFDLLKDKETCCNRCGRSVAFGTALWSNRLSDNDNFEVRKSKGVKYPEGNYICGECLKGDTRK
ncbi:MAG: hypothetical protein WAR79_00085 [Melioribacteraceae bacterium]